MNGLNAINANHARKVRRYSSQQEYEVIQGLRSLWVESEARLQMLRTVSCSSSEPEPELLKRWQARLPRGLQGSPWATQPDVHIPNGYFQARFPWAAERYGLPFLQHQETDRDGFPRTTLVSINEDFFAALLGGDEKLGHQTVFYQPEKTWFFYDPAREAFSPTTEAKLRLRVSNEMMMCAHAMNQRFVNVQPLYGPFRSDKSFDAIIERAEAMHAAGEDFFQNENNQRIGAPAKSLVPKLFVREGLAKHPKAVLTVGECFENHLSFCHARGLTPLQRREFRSLVAGVIREELGVGLRHDLRGEDGRTVKGWSGLGFRGDVLLTN